MSTVRLPKIAGDLQSSDSQMPPFREAANPNKSAADRQEEIHKCLDFFEEKLELEQTL